MAFNVGRVIVFIVWLRRWWCTSLCPDHVPTDRPIPIHRALNAPKASVFCERSNRRLHESRTNNPHKIALCVRNCSVVCAYMCMRVYVCVCVYARPCICRSVHVPSTYVCSNHCACVCLQSYTIAIRTASGENHIGPSTTRCGICVLVHIYLHLLSVGRRVFVAAVIAAAAVDSEHQAWRLPYYSEQPSNKNPNAIDATDTKEQHIKRIADF